MGAGVQDLGLRYVRLDGSTAVAERLTIVDSCAPCVPSTHSAPPLPVAAPCCGLYLCPASVRVSGYCGTCVCLQANTSHSPAG